MIDEIVYAIKKAETKLSEDTVQALRDALEKETNEMARTQLMAILKNVEVADGYKFPMCQDTGLQTFFLDVGYDFPYMKDLENALIEAVRKATKEIPLRPNAVHPFLHKNSGDNTGRFVPYIHWELREGDDAIIHVIPKGGGSENMSGLYMLSPGVGIKGIKKTEYWRPFLEDAMNLLAKLPVIAAYIYRRIYKSYTPIEPSATLDWGANFAHMMGYESIEYKNLMRLYLILHSDHESGNVSAHTNHLVSSALSDIYYSVSAAMNGLAGPLHGLANQECLKWILGLMEKFGGVPTEEEIEKFAWDTLNSGKVIPGYGHAVLRKTDPRYSAQREFALKYLPDDPIFQTVSNVYKVVPGVLQKHGKAKNPWPNVDAHSGALQYHYGVVETSFYTVLFGVSRALGITAEVIWDRALGLSIERPKSVTTKQIEEFVSA